MSGSCDTSQKGEASRDKQYDSAAEYISKVIERSPDCLYYDYRCLTYLKKEMYELALTDADKMISLKPSYDDGYTKKACALFGMGRPAEAQAVLTSVLESKQLEDRHKLQVFGSVSRWLRDKGDEETAIAILTGAIEEWPNDYDVYEHLCELYIRAGLHESALSDAGKMINLESDNYIGYHCKVRALVDMGQVDKAWAVLDNDISHLKVWYKAEVWCDAGKAVQKKGDHKAAIAFFTEAIKWYPKDDWYYLHRCQSAFEMGHYEAALNDAETVPHILEARSWIAKCLAMLGRFEDAIAASEEINSPSDLARGTKAFVYTSAEADAEFKANNYDKAIILYTKALEHHINVQYIKNRSIAYAQTQQWSAALRDADECIRRNVSDSDVCIVRAKCLVMLEQFEEASVVYDELEDKDIACKEKAAAYTTLADHSFKSNSYDKAIHLYTVAIQLNGDALCLLNRGFAHGHKQQWNDALNDVEECIHSGLSNDAIQRFKGKCLMMLELFDEAIIAYERVKDEDLVRKERAVVYNAQADAVLEDEAIDLYTYAIELDSDANYLLGRSIAYGRKERWEVSLKDIEDCIRRNQSLSEAYSHKGKCLTMLRRFKDAIVVFDKLPDKDERNRGKAYVYNAWADVMLKDGNNKRAIRHYGNAIGLEENAEYYLNRSMAYRHDGQWNLVLKDLEKALKLKPDLAKAWCQKGDALTVLGKFQEALNAYYESLKLEDSLLARKGKEEVERSLPKTSASNSTSVNVAFKNTSTSHIQVEIFENNNYEDVFIRFVVIPKTVVLYALNATKRWNAKLTRGRDETYLSIECFTSNPTYDVADFFR